MDLKVSVKDLVTKILNRKGLDTCSVPVEEILLLETYDEHFQNYQLVKYIREQIECELGTLVDGKLDCPQQQDEVAAIIDEILASEEYSELFYRLSNSTRTVVDELLDGSISQPSLRGDSVGRSSSVMYYNLENSVGSDWSSLRESQGEMFISHLKIKEIATKLSSNTENHLDALTELQQCPLGDLPQCPEWSEIKEGLISCLEDNDQCIVEMCLKILKYIFGNYSVSTAREVHNIIVRDLSSLMKQPLSRDILDLDTDKITLYKFRFLHYVHLHVSSHWIRYNERLLEDIIKEYFCLLELGYSYGTNSINCVHYLALIDCVAVWFHKWMHAEYSRAKVLDYLMENTNLIQYQVIHTIEYPNTIPTNQQPSTDENNWVYSMTDLNYLLYVHNMRVIEKVICYERGQEVLGKALSSLKGYIKSVSDLLVHIVETGFHCPSTSGQRSTDSVWSPVKLIANLLKCLASGNMKCRQLLCSDHFVNTVIKYLDKEETVNIAMLEEIVDALCVLVASVDGQKFLLKHKCTIKIVQYVIISLKKPSPKLSRLLQVCLFYCRQLYSTAEGLLSLLQYDLHNSIVHCLDNIKDKEWRRKLINNLLNFASTPKGVIILGQTKLLTECVQYMHERYQLKLQVSHCEKFGYGFMVTQVASTSCGMKCLIRGGYVSNLIQVLWTTLQEEDVEEPLVLYTHPLDPSNRILHKAIVNVLNVISSYTSLYEAIICSSPSSCNINPKTINDLLNLLLFTDSFHKVLNPMECHLCALRILSVLVTSLDSYLLLEHTFGITNHLYRLQKEIQLPNSEYIIDPCSIERNRILVATTFIGGPNERLLPPHYLLEMDDEYNYPLFSNSHYPSVFCKSITPKVNQKGIDISSCTTLDQVQNLFIKEIKNNTHLSSNNICLILQKGLEYQKKELQPIKLKPRASLADFEVIGIELVLRYGKERGLLKNSTSVDELSKLYLLTGGNIEKGFDWLVATLFIVFASVSEKDAFKKTIQFVETFSCMSSSLYNWKYHPLNAKDILCSVSIHHIELILQAELPLVHSAFKISGYSTSQACQDMINQCFWNYLDWPDICQYIVLLIVFGADYQVYFCVSIFSHLQSKILKACQDHNLLILLKEGMITEFNISKYFDYLKFLERKYRSVVLTDMNGNIK